MTFHYQDHNNPLKWWILTAIRKSALPGFIEATRVEDQVEVTLDKTRVKLVEEIPSI